MADITTKITGQDVTLVDNGDGTYRIDLLTSEARRFIRDGELARLRAERDRVIAERDRHEELRLLAIAARDQAVADKATEVAKLADLNANIAELVDWLQGQGDPT